MNHFLIYTDGGARGNPGHAAYGYICLKLNFKNQKSKILEGSEYIGIATNNQAEYEGVIAALENVKSLITNRISHIVIEVFLDSQLIVEQMNGRYKIKNEGLKPRFWKIRELIMELGGNVTFKHIPREQNKEADKLVNLAIDKQIQNSKIKMPVSPSQGGQNDN